MSEAVALYSSVPGLACSDQVLPQAVPSRTQYLKYPSDFNLYIKWGMTPVNYCLPSQVVPNLSWVTGHFDNSQVTCSLRDRHIGIFYAKYMYDKNPKYEKSQP